MALPTRYASYTFPAAGFATTKGGSIDIGSDPDTVVIVRGGENANTADTLTGVTLNGVSMIAGTAGTRSSGGTVNTFVIDSGSAIGSGSVTVTLTMSAGNSRPGLVVEVWHGCTGSPRYSLGTAAALSSSTTPSRVEASDVNTVVVLTGSASGATTVAAASGTTLGATTATGANSASEFAVYKGGAASVTLNWTQSPADAAHVQAVFVHGTAAAPIITGPTGGTPGTTTITIGATSDSPSDGTMRFLRRVGGSAASAATVASTGESQAATANPQSRVMTAFTAGSTSNFVDMVQVGAGGNSNVLSVGPFTMAAAGPTINTQPTAQTVSEGAAANYTVSATSSGGALSYQWQRQAPGGGAFSNVGTNSASYTTAGTVCATDHAAQLRVQVTDSNGTTQSATVGLTVNATASTSRPGADVTVAGWTASTGSDLFAMIDETSPADGDYITSPGLTSSTAPATFTLAFPLAAGNRVVGVRARTDTGAATLRVYLLNDAGTVMGTTADQAINSTFATYSLAVTLSGAATRARVEVVV